MDSLIICLFNKNLLVPCFFDKLIPFWFYNHLLIPSRLVYNPDFFIAIPCTIWTFLEVFNSPTSNIHTTSMTDISYFIMTFLWMMYSLIYSFMMFVLRFVVDCFILGFMMNYLIPCLCNKHTFRMPFFRTNQFPIFVVTFFWMLHSLCPSRRVHNPDKAVTNRCFLYRNKRGKVRIISRNNADTA